MTDEQFESILTVCGEFAVLMKQMKTNATSEFAAKCKDRIEVYKKHQNEHLRSTGIHMLHAFLTAWLGAE